MSGYRMDSAAHEYVDVETDRKYPNISWLLDQDERYRLDTRWMTDEHRERGRLVHLFTQDYDMEALDLSAVPEALLGYVEAWMAFRSQFGTHTFLSIEEPRVRADLGFAGTTDRGGIFRALRGVLEIKAGAPERRYEIQTALQAILEEPVLHVPAASMVRYQVTLKPNGTFRLYEHPSAHDLSEALRLVHTYGGMREAS